MHTNRISFSPVFLEQCVRMLGHAIDMTSRLENYRASCGAVGRMSRLLSSEGKQNSQGIWTSDQYVAEYCKQDPEHLIPFLSLDPTQNGWQEEMIQGHQDLKMTGIKLLPMYAGFYPQDRSARRPLDLCFAEGTARTAAYGDDICRSGSTRLHAAATRGFRGDPISRVPHHLGSPWASIRRRNRGCDPEASACLR